MAENYVVLENLFKWIQTLYLSKVLFEYWKILQVCQDEITKLTFNVTVEGSHPCKTCKITLISYSLAENCNYQLTDSEHAYIEKAAALFMHLLLKSLAPDLPGLTIEKAEYLMTFSNTSKPTDKELSELYRLMHYLLQQINPYLTEHERLLLFDQGLSYDN